MGEDSTIYVRTSKREFTFDTTLEILQKHFPPPSWEEPLIIEQPFTGRTQTHLFGDDKEKPGERDIIIRKK